ncbi:unnamed protein product [Auanema sp. JU1783]|nr:unnamed protein product [Auanema sp. JU1783]
MICNRETLLTACVALALFVAIQVFIFAISYKNLRNDIIQEAYLGRRVYPYRNISGQLPSALIIGVRKGGTRALLDALNLHPNIRTVRKETHFFDINYSKGLQWYKENMPVTDGKQIVIEKTPGYFTSPLAPERVFNLNPKMKVIVILRDPVQRTVSDFTQVYYNKLETNKTLPIFEEEVFIPGTKELNLSYKPIRNSIYHMHLTNWLKFFPINQILFVNGDVFRGNPLSEIRKVENFLQLPASVSIDQLVFNEKKGFFCFLKTPTSSLRCLGSSKGRTHRQIPSNILEVLRKQLIPFNNKFYKQINRIYSW